MRSINDPQPSQVYNMLMKNFDRAYNGNTRAPMGLYMHAAWFFGQDWHYQGYLQFLEEISDNQKYPDVWILPVRAGIEYRKDPKTNDEILANDPLRNRSAGPSGPTAKMTLFGRAGVGRSFVFLIDRSKSMGSQGLGAIAAAQRELVREPAENDLTGRLGVRSELVDAHMHRLGD